MAGCREHIRAGRVRALAVVSDTPVAGIEDVPLITTTSADYKKYLPWGPFYGVFVKKETPDAAKKVLVDAFQKGLKRSQGPGVHQELRLHLHGNFRGRGGEVPQQMAVGHDLAPPGCGGDKVSPEKFGIPKP